jgi:hypothetical protein
LHTSDGTDVVAGVVGKAPLVCVGKSAELAEGRVGENIRVGNARIVDLCNIDEVVDWEGQSMCMCLYDYRYIPR